MNREDNRLEKNEAFDWKAEIISWIKIIAAAAVIAFVLNNFIIANSKVPSGSMENTIMTGDRVIGSRLSYKFGDPKRGDIVIFHFPDDPTGTIYYVKRIIGLPGETVQIKGGYIFIDGELLNAEDGLEQVSLAGRADTPIKLEDNEYFLLGDNRDSSEDSRFPNIGNVKREQIQGKVWFRIFPLLKLDFIHSR